MKSITLRLSYLKCSIDARSEFLSAKVSENNILEKRLTAANHGSKLKKCSLKTFLSHNLETIYRLKNN